MTDTYCLPPEPWSVSPLSTGYAVRFIDHGIEYTIAKTGHPKLSADCARHIATLIANAPRIAAEHAELRDILSTITTDAEFVLDRNGEMPRRCLFDSTNRARALLARVEAE